MTHHISAVYTARQTARAVQTLLEANIGQMVEIEVTHATQQSLMVQVSLIQQSIATGVTQEGREVVISLGEPDESDSKYPTIVVG